MRTAMNLLSRIELNWLAAGLCAAALTACGGGTDLTGPFGGGGGPTANYVATSLVSDFTAGTNPYNGATVDSKLVNAWGIAFARSLHAPNTASRTDGNADSELGRDGFVAMRTEASAPGPRRGTARGRCVGTVAPSTHRSIRIHERDADFLVPWLSRAVERASVEGETCE
jgi:hypothetical protein